MPSDVRRGDVLRANRVAVAATGTGVKILRGPYYASYLVIRKTREDEAPGFIEIDEALAFKAYSSEFEHPTEATVLRCRSLLAAADAPPPARNEPADDQGGGLSGALAQRCPRQGDAEPDGAGPEGGFVELVDVYEASNRGATFRVRNARVAAVVPSVAVAFEAAAFSLRLVDETGECDVLLRGGPSARALARVFGNVREPPANVAARRAVVKWADFLRPEAVFVVRGDAPTAGGANLAPFTLLDVE
ncbi:hypothetical protein M885DRAFT_543251 [Pelagophyceae sp. CCMP2097]|nr:hypothetical protein M885DRAFT_543251 [Pelagophyceae sp. CCMP2097]